MENKKLRGISMDINKSWFARILSQKFKIVAKDEVIGNRPKLDRQ